MGALDDTIEVCACAFRILEAQVTDPVRVPDGDDFVFQYEDHNPHIVVVQKLSRIASGFHACLALMEKGLYQE